MEPRNVGEAINAEFTSPPQKYAVHPVTVMYQWLHNEYPNKQYEESAVSHQW